MKLFVPYELAILAKEKGFDEPCLAWYDENGQLLYAEWTARNDYKGYHFGEFEMNNNKYVKGVQEADEEFKHLNEIKDKRNLKHHHIDGSESYTVDYWRKRCLAPLYQQLVDWFRDKHGMVIMAVPCGEEPVLFSFIVPKCYRKGKDDPFKPEKPLPYYEALEFVLKQAFKLI